LDLRSDTVTQPTPGMRAAIAAAPVGDDVYGEDPTVRQLEERVAALLGKESALFVPSGTMGNQLGLLVHTRHGDEVIIGEGSHCAWYESGAGAALAGVQFAVAGQGGLFTVADMLDAIKPPADHFPRTRLVVIENTHNRAGGRIFPPAEFVRIAEAARAAGLALHLDGPASGMPASRPERRWLRSRRPSTPSTFAFRRVWARRLARRSSAVGTTCARRIVFGRCWEAACVRQAFWRPPRCTNGYGMHVFACPGLAS
jgi:hypothetical protein